MNIFVTSKCPKESAKNLDDKRVVKMCLETAQILCTVANEREGKQAAPYKSTHKGHPCVKWAMNYTNAKWLWQHGHALCDEFYKRYGKEHKCREVINLFGDKMAWDYNLKYSPREFQNCAANKSLGIDYTSEPNTFKAYQMYLADRWETDKKIPTWYGVAK